MKLYKSPLGGQISHWKAYAFASVIGTQDQTNYVNHLSHDLEFDTLPDHASDSLQDFQMRLSKFYNYSYN